VLLELRGLVDVDAELLRLAKQKEKVQPALEQLRRKMAAGDYETKVPEDVRDANTQKLQQYEQEISTIDEAIINFGRMK
jgi:valyl-tRNA synthetase